MLRLSALLVCSAIAIAAIAGSGSARALSADLAKDTNKFELDRQAILAMVGNYEVTFDFIETAALVEGYELKERKVSGGNEIVRVIEDRGDFISLQHILIAGENDQVVVKHWRQDWQYQPDSVLVYTGGNAWRSRPLSEEEARGTWSQVVYQVDDSPRYGAVAPWNHEHGISEWEPEAEWRPLPRRDATTRDDYHAINGMNRHVITPDGWIHEQDNTKLILTDEPTALVREIAINTYLESDQFDFEAAESYWANTADYWAGVRAIWSEIETDHDEFGLTIQGEPIELYSKVLSLAKAIDRDEIATEKAIDEADKTIKSFVTSEPGALQERLAE